MGDKRGTALVTALMITAIMAVVALALSQSLFFGIDRFRHIDMRDRAYWYALGAREFAESALVRSLPRGNEPVRPNDPWVRGEQIFPVDGGQLIGRVRDAQNCFNLNALVEDGRRGQLVGDEEAARLFGALLRGLDIPPGEAETLIAQITDWVDSDGRPEPRGAEDTDYAERPIAHRAANGFFREREELLALPVMTPALYARLSESVCALPTTEQPPLNLNSLRTDQAVLLAAVTENLITPAQAALILSRRPSNGYDNTEEFWSDAVFDDLAIDPSHRERTGLRTQFFDISVAVSIEDAEYSLTGLVEVDVRGQITRHYQRFGVFY